MTSILVSGECLHLVDLLDHCKTSIHGFGEVAVANRGPSISLLYWPLQTFRASLNEVLLSLDIRFFMQATDRAIA
jgi:hypothetical protein